MRIGASLRAGTAVALAAGVLVAANALSARLYARWKTGAVAGLSDRTVEVLRGARGVVEAVAVFERDNPLRDAANDLLDEFAAAAEGVPGLSFRVRSVDVNHDIAEASEILRNNPGLAVNSILFSAAGRTRAVDEFELAGEEDGGFAGERACASALLRLLHPGSSSVRFLSGHGEYDPADRNPVTGASAIGHALASNGFSPEKLVLGGQDAAVPADCRVLVVAGPRTMFSRRERELLADFLADGGRLLLLADDPVAGGLGPLLELWGLRLDPPPEGAGRPTGVRRSALSYGTHPSTRRMEGVLTVFSSPCAVSEAPPPASAALPPRVTPLVTADEPGGPGRCVAAVSEASRSPRAETRLAVFGDSDFISNALLEGGTEGNAMLFLSVVDWLGDFGRPVVPGESGGRLDPGVGTDRGWRRLALALALGVPACILAFGLLLYVPLARRR